MSPELAEIQAEVLTEAFNVNLESLVTKDYPESRMAVRFAEQQAYMDTRFAELKADFDSKFGALYVMVGIIMTAVALPYLERLLVL